MQIIGSPQETKRFVTGLWSLDNSLASSYGDIGFPLHSVTEIAGHSGVGKSTITFGLAGMLANQQDISLADLEGFEPKFLRVIFENSGFDGTLHYIQEEDDEETLNALADSIKRKSAVGILDSIGGISPIAEVEGDLGEANMGKRAKLLAQFARRNLKIWREAKTPKTLLMINHLHPMMGTRGYETPGGVTIGYLAKIRMRVKRKEEFPDGSYVVEGTIIKNKFGYIKRNFYLFVLFGYGIHPGLTAFYDATLFTKTVKRGERQAIKVKDESVGRISDLVKRAIKGETEIFDVFKNELSGVQPIGGEEEEKVKEETDE